ncbi:hypothetical protein LCGC14_0851250 [marine sediment metagenome]|uniref:Uncharacterized protein n=1 Tax=marine sediment metagenome TaxID=412755 RepID=A0A0F9SH82_9ZZZZ
MSMKVGSFQETKDCLHYETLKVFEEVKKNWTQINWLINAKMIHNLGNIKYSAVMEQVTLRTINAKPWMIQQLFEEEKRKE